VVQAEELVVAIQSEGVNETQSNLEGVERTMDDTAESAGDSAAELEGFAERFQGAMGIAVSALAVAGAGLLSQLPIIGEVTSGISAIIDSLILKIDKDLRPALSRFRDDLFNVAQDVRNTDGALEGLGVAFKGVRESAGTAWVTAIQTKIQDLLGITIPQNWLDFGFDLITFQFGQTFSNLEAIVNNFVSDVGVLLESINPKAARTWSQLLSSASTVVSNLQSSIASGISRIQQEFVSLGSGLVQWADGLASDAKSWGKDLINGFIAGIKSVVGQLRQWLSDLRDIGGDIGIDIPDLGGLGDGGGGGGGGGNSTGRSGGRFTSTGGTRIDGRQLTESTGRYRSDPGRRRGL
jgi:hypothetical protein